MMDDRIIRNKDSRYVRHDKSFLDYYKSCAKESLKNKDMESYKNYMKIIKDAEDRG